MKQLHKESMHFCITILDKFGRDTNLLITAISGNHSLLIGTRIFVMLPNLSGSHDNWKSSHVLYKPHNM